MDNGRLDPVSIDVGRLVRRNVASLYSSLVTRPTGQAVRLAIENVLAEEAGSVSLSIVDFSQVTVIDYSCADEVVAKLLLRYLEQDRPREAFFLLRGIRELHRDPIEVVLERHDLLAVAESESGGFELLGSASWSEQDVWAALERRGSVKGSEVVEVFPGEDPVEVLDRLVQRRVAFRTPAKDYQALSAVLRDLA